MFPTHGPFLYPGPRQPNHYLFAPPPPKKKRPLSSTLHIRVLGINLMKKSLIRHLIYFRDFPSIAKAARYTSLPIFFFVYDAGMYI